MWGTSLTTTIIRNPKVDVGYWQTTAANTMIGQKPYPNQGWPEWYAQSFAIQANTTTNGGGVAVIQDALVKAGFFQCTAGTGSSGTIDGFLWYIYHDKPVALPKTCTDTLPGGWKPLS